MNIVRKLKTTELTILTELFNYKDVDDMITENICNIENGIVDIFAMFDNDKLIGELHVKYDNEDKDFAKKGKRAYLYAFRIHKDYQGKGLGSYLLETVIDELTNNGYHELTVGVEDDNLRARYMYEKHGFTNPIARIKETYQGDSYEYNLLLRKETLLNGDYMKTLILNGSPRKNGDTVSLINKLTEQLNGEYKIVDAYYSDISACVDCRYCWNNDGCSINDEMTEIYSYIEDCDNVVIASPIYFSQPTGKLLDVCSRIQTYFAAKHFRNQKPSIKPKKGAVILVGGGDGNPEDAYKTACTLLHHINVTEVYPSVGCFNTNELPATKDNEAIKAIENIANFLNR